MARKNLRVILRVNVTRYDTQIVLGNKGEAILRYG